MLERSSAERVLVFLLRLGGAVLLLAWGAVFLPTAWMAECHRWLGLGSFPAGALTDYLTRTISALYGIHGGLLLVLSSDVRRHQPTIRYVALTTALYGAIVFVVDLRAGMPLFWTIGEGPPLVGLGVLLSILARTIAAAPASTR